MPRLFILFLKRMRISLIVGFPIFQRKDTRNPLEVTLKLIDFMTEGFYYGNMLCVYFIAVESVKDFFY